MPKLRRLAGKDIVAFFLAGGFMIDRQKGSHVILAKTVSGKGRVVVVPLHRELDRGTAYAIYKQVKGTLPDSDLKKFFYT